MSLTLSRASLRCTSGVMPSQLASKIDSERGQVNADRLFVERIDPKTEVVEVACVFARRGTAGSAQFAIHRNQVDEGRAGAKLDQPDLVLPPFDGAAKRIAVETKHGFEIDHSKDQMIDITNMNHPG